MVSAGAQCAAMMSTRSTLLPLPLLAAPSLNDPQPLVLYHDRCADGFAAALAAWRFYGGQVQCLGLSHGQIRNVEELPPLAGRAVYVLDFSFGPELLAEIDSWLASEFDPKGASAANVEAVNRLDGAKA